MQCKYKHVELKTHLKGNSSSTALPFPGWISSPSIRWMSFLPHPFPPGSNPAPPRSTYTPPRSPTRSPMWRYRSPRLAKSPSPPHFRYFRTGKPQPPPGWSRGPAATRWTHRRGTWAGDWAVEASPTMSTSCIHPRLNSSYPLHWRSRPGNGPCGVPQPGDPNCSNCTWRRNVNTRLDCCNRHPSNSNWPIPGRAHASRTPHWGHISSRNCANRVGRLTTSQLPKYCALSGWAVRLPWWRHRRNSCVCPASEHQNPSNSSQEVIQNTPWFNKK